MAERSDPEGLSVFVATGDPSLAGAIRHAFAIAGTGASVRIGKTIAELRAAAVAPAPDIVFCDSRLVIGGDIPGFNAEAGSYPVILLTDPGADVRAAAGRMEPIPRTREAIAAIPHVAAHAVNAWRAKRACLDTERVFAGVREELRELLAHGITERERFEQELQAREQQVLSFFSGATAGLGLLDRELRYLHVNETLARMNGLPVAAHLGKSVREIVPHLAPSIEPLLLEILTTGRAVLNLDVVGETRQQPGLQRHWVASYFPVCGVEGRPDGVGAIVVEITERVRAEEALRRSKEAIEATNRSLEAAVTLAREMADRAEAASAIKSRFLANVSHELRTPMNGVLGAGALLADTLLADDQSEYLRIILGSGQSMMRLIDNLLELACIDDPRSVPEPREFDLRAALALEVAEVTGAAFEKGLGLESVVAPEMPAILRGDEPRIRNVVRQLLGNAVKFTAHGSVRLAAAVDRAGERGLTVRITVSDTGIGVPESRRRDIFAPFMQADDSTTRQYGGAGLGLAIARQLVERMGGSIGFESREGEGSSFWFVLGLERARETSGMEPLPPQLAAVAFARASERAYPGDGPAPIRWG